MTIVIPMAGRGQRFVDAGYKVPKLLIEAHGKSLLQWSVDSLPLKMCERLVFVGLAEHEHEFNLSARIRAWYGGGPQLDFVFLPAVTGGQAETVLAAREKILPNKPLLIFNIDTAFHSPTLAKILADEKNDGVLGAFESEEPRFSFAAVDAAGQVTQVAEKVPISKNALTGLYHYRRASDFLKVADEAIKKNERVKGEFYVAPLYNALIAQGRRFVLDRCQTHYILGTPVELAAFLAQPTEQVMRELPPRLVMETPEVSFCVPVFNATERIERCLRAIVAQNVPSREILVVDNCSTDDTAAKAREILKDVPNARVIVNDKNLGRIENWNRCLEMAAGRYIRIAMVNDVWLPGSAEMLLKVARANPTAGIVCSRARFVTEMPSNPEPAALNPSIQVYEPPQLLKHFCEVSQNDTDGLNAILFQSEVIRHHQLRFRTDIPYWSDFYIVIELSQYGPVAYVQAESYLFDNGVKGRFAHAGRKILPYYAEVRFCSTLMAKLLAASGRPDWEGFSFLFAQYVNHHYNFGNAPLPGYRDTLALFKDTGPYQRQAFKHRLRWGLRHWFKHSTN